MLQLEGEVQRFSGGDDSTAMTGVGAGLRDAMDAAMSKHDMPQTTPGPGLFSVPDWLLTYTNYTSTSSNSISRCQAPLPRLLEP
jgi:hypothetical protein